MTIEIKYQPQIDGIEVWPNIDPDSYHERYHECMYLSEGLTICEDCDRIEHDDFDRYFYDDGDF